MRVQSSDVHAATMLLLEDCNAGHYWLKVKADTGSWTILNKLNPERNDHWLKSK